MHILQSSLFLEFWYVIVILIGVGITIVYYMNHMKLAFKNSLVSVIMLILMAGPMSALTSPSIDSSFDFNGLDFSGESPDFISGALERIVDFIRDRLI